MADWLKSGEMTARQKLDMPPVWLLGFVVLVWIIACAFPGAVFRHAAVQVFGVFWVLAGLALLIAAAVQFRAHATSVVPHQTPDRMITRGVFRRTRNPIYLADTLILTGVAIWSGALLGALLVPVFIWVVTLRFIMPEEARLTKKFGDRFCAYSQKTPRWL